MITINKLLWGLCILLVFDVASDLYLDGKIDVLEHQINALIPIVKE